MLPSPKIGGNMAFSLLIEGDCLKRLPSLANKSVDLVLCDLPYGATRNPWDTRIDFEALWREWKRVLKPEGVVCLFGQGAFTVFPQGGPHLYRWGRN